MDDVLDPHDRDAAAPAPPGSSRRARRPRRRSGRRRSRRGAARPGSVAERAGELEPLAVEQAEALGAAVGEPGQAAQLERLDAARVGGLGRAARSPCAARRRRSRRRSCPRRAAAPGARGRSRGGSAAPTLARVTSSPRNATVPSDGRSAPERTFRSVVLPAPLGPTMPTASPAPTAKSTPSRTTSAPKRFRIPAAARIGVDSDPTVDESEPVI